MGLAGFASGVDAVAQHSDVAAAALDARRTHTGLVGPDHLHIIGEPGRKIVGQFGGGRVGDVALLVGQFDVADGAHALGLAVIDDVIALKHPALVIKHHVAVGGDDVAGLVINELVGVDIELRGIVRLCIDRPRGRSLCGHSVRGVRSQRG
jgi:hypothetical protein